MASSTKKIILFSITILILSGMAIGYYMYNKGPLDVQSAKGTPVSANELYNIFSTDSLLAKKKFTGKVVEVSGEISEISSNLQQQKVVLVKTAAEGAHINCTLEEPANQLTANQKITIKGIASGIGQGDADLGIMGDVYLTRCYVVQP